MNYLLLPKKQPEYRANRDHTSFLTPLSKWLPSVNSFVEGIQSKLFHSFDVTQLNSEDFFELTSKLKKEAIEKDVYRTKLESAAEILQEIRNMNSLEPKLPSLVAIGPSCGVNH